jgi:hypothetical protein
MGARIFALLALCSAALPAQAQQSVDQQARRDLQSLLLPGASIDIGSILDGATATADFDTKPFATKYPGLCGRNLLLVGYAGPIGAGPDLQAKRVPLNLGVINFFYAPHGAVKPEPVSWADYHPFEGECAALTGKEDGWFRAGNAEQAAHGYAALTQALADIRSGKRNIAGCRKSGHTICDDFVEADYPRYLSSIWACPSAGAYDCYKLGQFTIHMGDDRKGAETLVRLEYEPLPALD